MGFEAQNALLSVTVCANLRERERVACTFFYSQVLGETLVEPDDENEELSFSVVDMNNALSSSMPSGQTP